MPGWRLCISGCPYKKIYFNWKRVSQKNVFSVIRELSPVSQQLLRNLRGSHSLSWRAALRRRRIEEAASTEREVDLYERQCECSSIRTIPR